MATRAASHWAAGPRFLLQAAGFTSPGLQHMLPGDSFAARAAYRRLAALWAEADPEVRRLVLEAERLANTKTTN